MFPTGIPGIALLLLRVSVAGALLFEAACHGTTEHLTLLYCATLAVSVSLCVGALTPIVSIVACILEWILWLDAQHYSAPFAMLAGLTTVVVALLGPGAYSVDARLLGRREIIFRPPDPPNA
jgi:hypothetical protein